MARSTLGELLSPDGAAELPWLAERLDAVADALLLGVDMVHEPSLSPDADADAGGVGIDPTIAAIMLAHHTRRVGLVVAAVVQRDHPYNVARRLASIDHASGGRAGLLIGVEDHRAAAGSPWTRANPVVAAADAVTVIRALWRSFPVDAIVADRESGVFAESHRIVAVDHRGAFDIAGPLQVPWSPQIWPPVLAWSAGTAEPALAQIADVVVGPETTQAVLHQVGSLAELRRLLRTAAEPERSPGNPIPLRTRFGLAPADPPTEGRQAFPDPAHSTDEEDKVVLHAR
ncbi:LLM class flavin-dependent oxidoreductase [Streptomyces sp. 110]|uniref:LLM class flavin-dependent oxidoreductase n=1 Tax=Streptomyces endocoffeicus TaxID=2898945 RepID=A0ABS1QAG5_9ACTN|nr:LLM class flavin-dependent oxidoreductase [Streptomyces endocoffeicus]